MITTPEQRCSIRLIAGPIICALLSGCVFSADTIDTIGLTQKQIEDRSSFVAVPSGQAWVNPPGKTVVMQRALRGGAEQRVGLNNLVAMPGDNVLILRTRSGYLASARFRFEEFMTRIGGAPAPFTHISSGDLLTAEDSLGTYFWAEETAGSSVSCVFAIRRLTSNDRDLPQDAQVLDILLRNCISGTSEEALAPIRDTSIGFSSVADDGSGGGTRMLSPLAAPGLE